MRFGQFMLNAITWIGNITRRDPFFMEEDEILELFKEYANTDSVLYREWKTTKNKQINSFHNQIWRFGWRIIKQRYIQIG